VSGIDIVGETYKQTKILEFFLKMPSDYWSKFLMENHANELSELPSAPMIPQVNRTPVISRQHQYQNTTPKAYPAPTNTFFSPI
jgi:hypothetical protein